MKVREGYYSEQIRNKAFFEVQLNRRQAEVLNVIRDFQPISNEGIAEILNIFPHQVTPRVLELRKLDIVEFAGETISTYSKRTVSLWRIKAAGKQLTLPLS
jgi:predicted HTH transcriptional regulator